MKKLLSRKLWVAVSAAGASIASAVTGTATWADVLPVLAAIVIGYCVSQGWVDAKALAAQSPSPVKTEEHQPVSADGSD